MLCEKYCENQLLDRGPVDQQLRLVATMTGLERGPIFLRNEWFSTVWQLC
jgi:hypothetical protein